MCRIYLADLRMNLGRAVLRIDEVNHFKRGLECGQPSISLSADLKVRRDGVLAVVDIFKR